MIAVTRHDGGFDFSTLTLVVSRCDVSRSVRRIVHPVAVFDESGAVGAAAPAGSGVVPEHTGWWWWYGSRDRIVIVIRRDHVGEWLWWYRDE